MLLKVVQSGVLQAVAVSIAARHGMSYISHGQLKRVAIITFWKVTSMSIARHVPGHVSWLYPQHITGSERVHRIPPCLTGFLAL